MPDAAAGIRPFILQTAPAALEDLNARLRSTRWPDVPEDPGWALGTDPAYLRELVVKWSEGFDWLAHEAALARFPHFRARLCGLPIHFVHVRAAAPADPGLPLILRHGWPDSFWRFTTGHPAPHRSRRARRGSGRRLRRGRARQPGYGYSGGPLGSPLDSIAVAACGRS